MPSAPRAVARGGWSGGDDGRCHRPHATPVSDLRRLREGHLPERAREDARELVRVAGEVVVEVRQADRDVLVEDRLDLRAGRLLGVDADRRLELGERRVERRRRVLRRVPDALRLERGVEVDVRRGPVAVVDDAELGGAGARRSRAGSAAGTTARRRTCRGSRPPTFRVIPACCGLALEERGQVRDLLELAGVEGRPSGW